VATSVLGADRPGRRQAAGGRCRQPGADPVGLKPAAGSALGRREPAGRTGARWLAEEARSAGRVRGLGGGAATEGKTEAQARSWLLARESGAQKGAGPKERRPLLCGLQLG
jgi:hypothetical protein